MDVQSNFFIGLYLELLPWIVISLNLSPLITKLVLVSITTHTQPDQEENPIKLVIRSHIPR